MDSVIWLSTLGLKQLPSEAYSIANGTDTGEVGLKISVKGSDCLVFGPVLTN